MGINRAETWPLTKPLQCVSLRIERRGDVLLLIFTYTIDGQKGSKLFALCSIDILNAKGGGEKGGGGVHQHHPKLEHYVEAVVDSTRYFVIRVTDEKAGREALIGLGFRDREEAGDFRAALAKYETDIQQGR
jgi:adaptin ear-binding coat-associated protein 1/2